MNIAEVDKLLKETDGRLEFLVVRSRFMARLYKWENGINVCSRGVSRQGFEAAFRKCLVAAGIAHE